MTLLTKYFDDFALGDVVILGVVSVKAAEIIAFAEAFDPQPMYLDGKAARDALRVRWAGTGVDAALVPLEGLVASNWHVGAMFMRCFYDGLLAHSSSRGSPGIERLDFPSPVRPHDTISFQLEVIDIKPSRSRPDMGLVLFEMDGINQSGETVMSARSWTMFGRREIANVV